MANGIMGNGAILWIFFRLSPRQTPFIPLRLLAVCSPDAPDDETGRGEEGRYEKRASHILMDEAFLDQIRINKKNRSKGLI